MPVRAYALAAPPGAGEWSTGARLCMSGSSWSVSAIFV